ncbi:DUF4917 family protein [Megasphaera stantonii]|uniref:DUF4917 family protein n=1 Tax=Megasphaera stantonii TaxID=2144175 RepID=UPI00195AF27B|nr:DUF4917 family protein [Megasphaera stantonii]MBM6733384.1 DUF4917 family protein [Megasphaera stantonii]
MTNLKDYEDIFPDGFSNKATLILGNGASIAFSDKFLYRSLFENAKLEECEKDIFNKFDTNDFEYILRKLYHASQVNQILEIESNKVTYLYEHIRKILIETIQEYHIKYEEFSSKIGFIEPQIREFLEQFHLIFDLNYDLILYWIFNKCFQRIEFDRFADGFKNRIDANQLEFDKDFMENHEERIKIFYPHGNLLLIRDEHAREAKITRGSDNNLLEEIYNKWNDGWLPLFISEGTSEQKIASIRKSRYLSYVYDHVLRKLDPIIVIYGWSFGKQDEHLIKKVFSNCAIRHVAISIFTGNSSSHDINLKIDAIENLIRINNPNQELQIDFFKSDSVGCWINQRSE